MDHICEVLGSTFVDGSLRGMRWCHNRIGIITQNWQVGCGLEFHSCIFTYIKGYFWSSQLFFFNNAKPLCQGILQFAECRSTSTKYHCNMIGAFTCARADAACIVVRASPEIHAWLQHWGHHRREFEQNLGSRIWENSSASRLPNKDGRQVGNLP